MCTYVLHLKIFHLCSSMFVNPQQLMASLHEPCALGSEVSVRSGAFVPACQGCSVGDEGETQDIQISCTVL